MSSLNSAKLTYVHSKRGFLMCPYDLQGTEEKGVGSEARPAEAVGLVLGTCADDIRSLEGGDWPAGQDRTRRVKR